MSWVRNSDSHILFIGLERFVHEDRYELIPARHGKWTLKVKYVTAKDAGKFECQVSTVPKLNQTFTLKVIGKGNKCTEFLNSSTSIVTTNFSRTHITCSSFRTNTWGPRGICQVWHTGQAEVFDLQLPGGAQLRVLVL